MAHPARSTALGVLAGLGALLLTAPRPAAALRSLGDAGASTDPTGPLVAAVALGAWAVTGWLALTVAAVVLARLPGLGGRCATALAVRVAPVAVRRTVESVLGLTVAVCALTPTAALAGPVPAPAAAVADAAWDLDWPDPAAVTAPVRPSAAAVPSRPAPQAAPAPAAPTGAVRPSAVAPAAQVVVVRPGDSLWSLAEASLRSRGTAAPTDRQVARAWPRWWAANRAVIGDDPDLLLPGTVLLPPTDRP